MADARIVHPFPPLIDENCEILILGSFPSVKSREINFFYGHPQNRFWKVLAALFDEPCPQDIDEKKAFLLAHHIALWDTIQSCTIHGSSDASIKDVIVNPIAEIIKDTKVHQIYCNGKLSYQLYHRYVEKQTHIKAIGLPSTSPANASYSLERLIDAYQIILKQITQLT